MTEDLGDHARALVEPRTLRRTVLTVAGLNLGYFWVQVAVALAIGSVALLADSIDLLEDTAVNLLIFVALGWPLGRRALAGRMMAGIILVPALAASWAAFDKAGDPTPPDVRALLLTAGGAALVNGTAAWLLSQVRHHGGSMTAAAFLSARNDVLVNVAIMLMAVTTWWTGSGWPDIVLGVVIVAVNVGAAREVWEVATEERLAARALAGKPVED